MYPVINEIGQLVDQWTAEADRLESRHGELGAAQTTRTLASELRSRLDGLSYQALEIEAAAQLSGYSRSRLRELVRDETIPNAGEKYAPRIRLIDLPKKPGHLPPGDRRRDVPGARSQVVRSVASQS